MLQEFKLIFINCNKNYRIKNGGPRCGLKLGKVVIKLTSFDAPWLLNVGGIYTVL